MAENLKTTACRSCGKPMLWLKNAKEKTGKSNPIDAEPNAEKGNMLVDLKNETYQVLTSEDLAKAKRGNMKLYSSHFATCPDANNFRRK